MATLNAAELQGPRGDSQLKELASGSTAVMTQDLIRRLREVISQFDESENG
ncbi:MAG: hypothetical protein M3Y18_09395 [Candidatus Eremiobacteraeota bacterium]|nr:hypothetical protein [Candidatus Eremiobacteraeota bacterium]